MPETEEQPVADVSRVAAIMDTIFEKDPNAAPVLQSAEPPVVAQVTQTDITPAPDKPPAVSDELPETLPNEGRGEKWKQFRAAHEATKKELVALKAQQEEFGATRQERDDLKARTAEYEARIAKLSEVDSIARLENDEGFKAKYDTQREAAVGKLKELAGYADIPPDELLSVLSKAGKDKYSSLENILELAPSVLKTEIAALVKQVGDIDVARRSELATAQESLAKRQQERAAQESEQRAQYQKRAEDAFKRTSASLSKELGIDEATISEAREFFDKNSDLEAASKVILEAFAARKSRGKDAEKDKQLAEMSAELAKYRESNPSITSGGDTKPPAKDVDFITAIREGAREARII